MPTEQDRRSVTDVAASRREMSATSAKFRDVGGRGFGPGPGHVRRVSAPVVLDGLISRVRSVRLRHPLPFR
jgi:hypothetical protein